MILADDPAFATPLVPEGSLGPMPGPAAPFVWGRGAGRLTPEEVEQARAEARQMQAAGMDFSPVQSWTQGAARVAQALVGGMENRRANKAADANADESRSVVQSLLAADTTDPHASQGAVLSALANPYLDDKTRSLVGAYAGRLSRPPQAAHFFEANNGDQGVIDPVTGQVKILFHDPTPKVQWVRIDNGDGTFTMQPVVNGQMGGQPGASPPATLPPDFDFGGPTPSASGNFLGG